ncbi:hypothetical protein BGZ61DRAFT_442901 [Ilyonectria robusta]|uniref:uncharacterized protein n=1 Tax=Ilyonectria robusta TaxID=1079257 RepID=UPI001E8D9C04|nr:uncharacterized protein BGZ61DRAFT_442901 [Ilyonectria robusta]KAH8734655.1 hypothetical protein BGZ61DRAFT_442901 [Ilyonectria robusta]
MKPGFAMLKVPLAGLWSLVQFLVIDFAFRARIECMRLKSHKYRHVKHRCHLLPVSVLSSPYWDPRHTRST